MTSTGCKKMIDQIIRESVGESDLLSKSIKYWAGAGAHSFQMFPFSLGCSCRYAEGKVSVKHSVLTTPTILLLLAEDQLWYLRHTLSLFFPSITLELWASHLQYSFSGNKIKASMGHIEFSNIWLLLFKFLRIWKQPGISALISRSYCP